MSEQRNLIIAIVLSVVVVFGWQYLVGVPKMEAERAKQAQTASAPKPVVPAPVAPRIVPRAQIVAPSAARTAILTPTLDGSINLVGARFDDLRLRNYRLTTDPQSPEIELLNPVGSEHPYYAEFGWTGAAGATAPITIAVITTNSILM